MNNRGRVGYVVDIKTRCTNSEHADERYGSRHESYDNIFKSIRRCRGADDWPSITSVLDLPSGQEVFAVWLEYSMGDSFGQSNCGSRKVVGIFTNYKDAQGLQDSLY